MNKFLKNKKIENVLGNPLYSAFITVFIFTIFWILINNYLYVKLKYLSLDIFSLSVIFEICLISLFSICYFLVFKTSMSKEFIKNFVSRFSFLLFIAFATFYTITTIHHHYFGYKGVITPLFDELTFYLLIASFLYVSPCIIICVLTLIITNKLFGLYKKINR
jgi:hypothetical protein